MALTTETRRAIRDMIRAAAKLDATAEAAEDALLGAMRRGEARAFRRMAELLAEQPDLSKLSRSQRFAWYRDQVPQFTRIASESYPSSAVRSYLDNYPNISRVVEQMIAAGSPATPTEFIRIPGEVIKSLRAIDLKIFQDLNTAALTRLEQTVLNNAIVGRTPSGMLREMRGVIKGSYKWGTTRGLYEWHAGTYVRTAGMRFSRIVTKSQADELELKHFVYIGPGDAKTREFCLGILGQAFTAEEAEGLDNGQTGDAFTDGGGWNCRHMWNAISKQIFDELRMEDVEVIPG